MGNICYIFSPLNFALLQSRCYNIYGNFKLFWSNNIPQTSLRYTPSLYIAELYYILRHCRAKPYLFTLPKNNLSRYITEVCFQVVLGQNSIHRSGNITANITNSPRGRCSATGMPEMFLKKIKSLKNLSLTVTKMRL